MYSSVSRTYRGAKSGIAMANIVIAIGVFVCVVLSIFKVYKEMFFFPAIFYLGAIMNFLTGISAILDKRKVAGVGSCMIGAVVLVFAVYATLVFWV